LTPRSSVAVVSAMVRGAVSRIRRRGRSVAETVVFDASRSARTGGLRAKSRVADNARRISILETRLSRMKSRKLCLR
jgi:hypothetical protein